MAETVYLAVPGFAKAGKSAIVDHICNLYGFQVIKPSIIIIDELKRVSPEQTIFTRSQIRAKGEEMRRLMGPAFYLNSSASSSDRLLIDGPRHVDSIQTIKSRGGFVLGVIARPDVRYERALAAADKLVPSSLEEFFADERHELNDITGRGGQVLRILWETDPQDIIDTSDISLSDAFTQADIILKKHGITPNTQEVTT